MATTKRSPYDFYPTPWESIRPLIPHLGHVGSVYEPAAGSGNLLQVLRTSFPKAILVGSEIDEAHKEQLQKIEKANITFEDFLTTTGDDVRFCFEWIITNPPFSLAQEFIEHIMENKAPTTKVCLLLRLGFLGSQKRKNFWQKYPPDQLLVLSKRPSFTGSGTDSQEYAWFIWDNEKHENPIQVI